MSQYTGSYQTDGCVGELCGPMFSETSSLSQGSQFANMTKDFHGGKRRIQRSQRSQRKNRNTRNTRNTRNQRNQRKQRQNGGSVAAYPASFSDTLPQNMHASANITSLDKAFDALPSFAGKYGTMTGGKRNTRKTKKMKGGIARINAPGMILTAPEERAAFLNPQWYTENTVIPSFKGPDNSYAAQSQAQYANQFAYTQKAGSKRKTQQKKRNSRK